MSNAGTPKATMEKMFAMFMADKTKASIADKFGVAKTTVIAISKREKWGDRKTYLHAEAVKRNNEKILEKTLTNLEVVQIVRQGVAVRLLQRMQKKNFKANVRDFVLVLELEEKMAGNLSTDPQSHVINVWNTMPEARQDQLTADILTVRDRLSKRNSIRVP